MRILIVEHEMSLALGLLESLKAHDFIVDLVQDGEEGLLLMSEVNYDLIILDMGLPLLDGLTVLRRARMKKVGSPVLILSERNSLEDCLRGFEAGADDYVRKPFAVEEVLARSRALLRRPAILEDRLSVADLELDRAGQTVKRAGRPISLTQREYALLEYLMRNAGHPVSRSMVVENVWSLDFEGQTNIVDVYIKHLRGKIDSGFEKNLIHTARGFGYMLADLQQEAVPEFC